MADFIQKDNSGSLFKNDRRKKETQPNAKGSCVIDGLEYWVSSWTKKDRNGNLYQSLSFQRKEQPQTQSQGSRPPQRAPQRNAPRPSSGFDDFEEPPF